jgi:hypothetical protein
MTHPANEALKGIEDNFHTAVKALLKLIDKHGADTLQLAMEEALEIHAAEQED